MIFDGKPLTLSPFLRRCIYHVNITWQSSWVGYPWQQPHVIFTHTPSCHIQLLSTTSSLETAAQRKIISLLVEIKEEQQRQWAVLSDLQARLQGQTDYEEEDVEALDMELPLRTLEQLDEMERQLEDAGIQKRMVVKMVPFMCNVMLKAPKYLELLAV